MIWAMILLGWILDSAGPSPIFRSVGAVISTTILFGYPFLLIFGFPAQYSSNAARRLSILSLSVLGLICITSLIYDPSEPENQITGSWIKFIIGVPIDVFVFAPFFVATHILGQARRSLGVYKPLDSIGAWVSLFFFAFGGVFFLPPECCISGAIARRPWTNEYTHRPPRHRLIYLLQFLCGQKADIDRRLKRVDSSVS